MGRDQANILVAGIPGQAVSPEAPEPEKAAVVVVGADRLLWAVGLSVLSVALCFGLDGRWACAVPAAAFAVLLAGAVCADTRLG